MATAGEMLKYSGKALFKLGPEANKNLLSFHHEGSYLEELKIKIGLQILSSVDGKMLQTQKCPDFFQDFVYLLLLEVACCFYNLL